MSDIPSKIEAALAGRYTLERQLGEGGMATVYLAEDLKHKRNVAVKVLRPELAAVLGAERFVQEITTTASLQHPNILPLFDSGEADGLLFYVMPYIDGETLRDRLNRETQLGVEEAVRITCEAADALDYAHRQGVIHRDIKPENILLHDGRPMVADFGIALAVSAAAGGRMTETGLSLGTPHYMSPEQATAEKDLSARSDIYSLGSVLYEMLTGDPPHTGSSAQQIIMKIVTDTARPITELRKSVPPHVAAATSKSLEKLPADRFDSAAAFAEALRNPAFTTAAFAETAAASTMTPSSARRALPWALATVGIAAAVFMGVRAGDSATNAGRSVRFTITAAEGEDFPGDVTVAPDGSFIVYAVTRNGVTQLHRRYLNAVSSEPLPSTQGASSPATSPDGRWLAFVGPDESLRKLPLDGSRSVRLATFRQPPIGVSWSENHGLILGMLAYSSRSGLSRVAEEGDTTVHVLTEVDGMHHDPYVIPGTDVALFGNFQGGITLGVASLADGAWEALDLRVRQVVGVVGDILVYLEGNDLMAVPFDVGARRPAGEPIRVAEIPGNVGAAAIATDGTLVMHVRPEAFQAVLVDERGAAEIVFPDSAGRIVPRFSPDGNRAVFAANFRGVGGALWIYDFRNSTLSSLPVRGGPFSVEWSPDGGRLIWNTFARRTAWWLPADASDSSTVLFDQIDARLAFAQLAPDGETLVLGTQFGEGGTNVVTASVGDTAVVPFAAGDANEMAPRVSPDGAWIAYASDESGRFEVYARPFPGPGPRVQLSDGGGGQPVWARDGRRLFYRAGTAVAAVDVTPTPGGGLRVDGRVQLFDGPYYGAGGEWLNATYDVAPDGRRFLMARAAGAGRAEIVVWTNWLDELEARLNEE